MAKMIEQPDFQTLILSYRTGFITSYEFIYKYMDFLNSLGVGQTLADIMHNECQDLAEYLIGILEGSGNQIENYIPNVI